MVNVYTAHKPDKRFPLNFQYEFRNCYPLKIWFDFKSTGPPFRVLELVHNFRNKPRILKVNVTDLNSFEIFDGYKRGYLCPSGTCCSFSFIQNDQWTWRLILEGADVVILTEPTLKIFWFAVYRPTPHFTLDSINVFGCVWKIFLLLLFINSFKNVFLDREQKEIFPSESAWKFWVSKQQTKHF